jgi:diguanylate cyclase (GGDEF)-like protein
LSSLLISPYAHDTAELNSILLSETIYTVYQPIVSLQHGDLIGYEALSRGPSHSPLHSPDKLFRAAEINHKTSALEALCRKKAIENIHYLDPNKLLFINIHPHIFCDPHLKEELSCDLLNNHHLLCRQIVFEITEKSAIEDFEELKNALAYYKAQGYNIAIDDMGSGHSGLNLLHKVHPHFLKIDMDLVRNIDKEPFKQSIVECLVNLAKLNNIKLIAEGIETSEELTTLINLGVYAGQGYFLGKPSAVIQELDSEIKDLIIYHYNQKTSHSILYNYSQIGQIAEQSASFPVSTKCIDIQEYFNTYNELGCCIVHNKKPVGLMMKYALDSRLATLYGVSVFTNRPIALIMDPHPIIVDYRASIIDVSKIAMNRSIHHIYDYIIVTKEDDYYGTVTVKSLLEYTTMIERNFARELNPLTALPGNRSIQAKLHDCLHSNRAYCLLYLDLDHFKAYNDIYGFENGDLIIKYTAKIITSLVESYCGPSEFVGHIGGDDFVCLLDKPYETGVVLSQKILSTFDEGIVSFFNASDLATGYMMGVNRRGKAENFPLTCLSVAGLYGLLNKFESLEAIGAHMAKLKKKAKESPKSSYVMEYLN